MLLEIRFKRLIERRESDHENWEDFLRIDARDKGGGENEFGQGVQGGFSRFMIINAGIKKVVCEKRYQSGAESLLSVAGVQVCVLNEEVEKY
jgi:hypothetical protein